MKTDYEEIRDSNHGPAFDRFLNEIVSTSNYQCAVCGEEYPDNNRRDTVHLILGSAFKAGLVEGKINGVKTD